MNARQTITTKLMLAAAVSTALAADARADDRFYTAGTTTNGTAYLTGTNWAGGIYAGTYGATTAASGTATDVALFNSPLIATATYVNFGTVNALSTGLGYFSSGALVVLPGLTSLGTSNATATLTVGGLKPAVASTVAGIWQLNGATVNTGASTLNNVIAAVVDGSVKNLSLANEAVTATVTDGSAAADRVATVNFRLGTTTANAYVTAGRTLSMNGVVLSEATPGSSLNKYGAGTMSIGTSTATATNTFTGGLNVFGGTVNFYSRNNLGAGPVTLDGGTLNIVQGGAALASLATQNFAVGPNGGTFGFNTTTASSFTVTNGFTGSGRLTVTGNGAGAVAQVLTAGAGPAARTGGVTVTGGATYASTFTNAFGANPATLVADQIRLDNGTIRYTDTGSTINFGSNKGITLGAGGGGIVVNSNTETLVLNAPVASDPGTNGTLTVGLGSTVTAGPGTLRMTANNTYTGPTVVAAGILRDNGTHTNAGSYTVNAGATYGGSGTVTLAAGNNVSVQGTLSPGALLGTAAAPSIGNFTLNGDVTLNNGTAAGTLLIDTSNTATQVSDNLIVSGALTLSGATLTVNGQPAIDGSATVIANYGSRSGNFGTTNLPAGYTLAYDYGTGGNQLALLRTGISTLFFTGSQDNVLTTSAGGVSNFTTDAGGTTPTGATPSGGTDVVFAANANANTANFNTVLGTNVTVNSLTFNSTTPTTIGGTNTLTVVAGTGAAGLGNGIVNGANAVNTTISAPVAIASSQTFTNNNPASPLTVSGTLALGANTLTVSGPGTTALSGVISGTGGLTKTGSGLLSVNPTGGPNAYTGTTTVKAGTLTLVGNLAADLILTGNPTGGTTTPAPGQGADIQGGRLTFANATADTLTSVKALLTAGYNQPTKFASGLLRSTTAGGNKVLGYANLGSDVVVAYTISGDANLDGQVNFADFVALQSSFGATGTTFGQGDFNYDNMVNFADFVTLQSNFGQTVTGGRSAFSREEYAAVMSITGPGQVPEPAGLAVLGLSAAGLLRRRRSA